MKFVRLACLFATVVSMLVLAQSNSALLVNQSNGVASASSPAGTRSHKKAARVVKTRAARQKFNRPPGSPLGLLSATQIPVGLPCDGYPNCSASQSPFPAVLGSFTGVGTSNLATVVKTHHPIGWAISVEVPNSNGFTPALTNTTSTTSEYDPILMGSLLGDGVDDLVLIHYLSGTYEVLLNTRNGTGEFQSQGVVSVTSNEILGGTLAVDSKSGDLDLWLVDGASPGNVYTLLGNGNGTFQKATSVKLNIQLSAASPFTTVVVANLAKHTNGKVDIAANANSNNQLNVFIATTSGYSNGVALGTPDGTYFSCFNTAGDLSTVNGPPDLVSANCRKNNITIFVNNGSGTFASGQYYSVLGGPIGASIGDVNGDGVNDVVTVEGQSGDIASLLGNGDGTVQNETGGFVTGGSPQVPAVLADLNGSGNLSAFVPDDEYSYAYLTGNGDGTFASAINFYAKGGNGLPKAYAIASGDFNGDGIPDFVIGNSNSGVNAGITVFLSNANGTLQRGVNYFGSATANLEYVAVGDFNNNGTLDIAATDSVNGGIQIFTGNGDGTFNLGSTFASDSVQASTLGIVATDLNGDGLPDIAVVNSTSATTADVGVLLNTSTKGSFSFAKPVNYPLSNVGTLISAGTLKGGLTLVVPLYGTASNPGSALATFLDNGNGTFQAESDVDLMNDGIIYYNPFDVAIGDVNGDGIPDLTVTIDDVSNLNDQGLAVLLGNSNGTFQAPTALATTLQDPSTASPYPAYVQIGDINGDGIPDLVASNSNFGTVSVLFGAGGGAFDSPVEYPAGKLTYGLALADITGDGTIAVAATGNSTDFSGITVLLNANAASLPSVSFNPTSVNFGNQGVGIASSPQVITLTDTGSAVLFIKSIAITGTNSGDYAQTNNCPSSVQPNGSCQISVTFTPTATGTRSADVTVTDNASNSPQSVPLTGVGTPPGTTFNPTSLTFATQLVNTTSAAQPVQLTNSGTGLLEISKISVTGAFLQNNNCPSNLQPNASCTFNIEYKPTGKGTQNGSLNVADNAPGSPQQVPLTGTGTWVQLAPTSLSFGNQKVHTKGAAKKITMTNKGTGPVNISGISITGTDAKDFTETNNCPAKLASKAKCTIKVIFDPKVTGQLSADVSVSDDGGGSPQTVSLSGTGTT
jgi:hypothetical protein